MGTLAPLKIFQQPRSCQSLHLTTCTFVSPTLTQRHRRCTSTTYSIRRTYQRRRGFCMILTSQRPKQEHPIQMRSQSQSQRLRHLAQQAMAYHTLLPPPLSRVSLPSLPCSCKCMAAAQFFLFKKNVTSNAL